MAVSLLALDRAGGLDRAAVEQELFGQSGFTGVGVRNDRKGAPPADLVFVIHLLFGFLSLMCFPVPERTPLQVVAAFSRDDDLAVARIDRVF